VPKKERSTLNDNIATGADYVIRGAKLLPHKSLRLFVVVPLLVNIVIFGSLIGVGYSLLNEQVDRLMGWIPDWLGFIEWILWPLITVAFALMTGYLFTALALIIASPFNALLAEKAEELITGKPVDSLEGLGAALLAIPRGIVREILKLLYYLPMLVLVLLLTFIPLINTVSPIAWFVLGAWMMSLQFVDYPMDNHQLSFGQVKQAVRSKRLTSLGFGGVVALFASIPIVNFFVVPSAVVGATLFWCEQLQGSEYNRSGKNV
jgi:CysZ protein